MLRAIVRNESAIRGSLKNATKMNVIRCISNQCISNLTAQR